MAGGFKRSKWFGLIGVFVVAGLAVIIALTTGSGESNPKLTMGLIFGVIAVFFVVLLALQRSDLERAASAGARGGERAAAERSGREIVNPTTMQEPELWAALAVRTIDDDAVRARSRMWDAGRRSQRLGMVIVLLILLTVPPVYLLESFAPLLIGVPLIVIAALYGGIRAVGPGGEMDRAYELVGEAMSPLGLEVVDRPTVGIEMRDPVTRRMGPRVRGELVLAGERHGRHVTVRLGSDTTRARSEVAVGGAVPGFEAKARDGRVRPDGDPAAPIAEALAAVPNSSRWRGVSAAGGPDGVVVTRRGGKPSDWMCDLWLAERLAEAG